MIKRVYIMVLFAFIGCFSTLKGEDLQFPELELVEQDSLLYIETDTLHQNKSDKPLINGADSDQFIPSSSRAVWMSALAPGLGQIYNRRYWKLPFVVGGYMGLIYATSWNGRYFTDYSNAYQDIMDNDPNTNSYMDFVPSYETEESLDKAWLRDALKRKKDFYRRNRDLCIISMVGLYLVCMIDAYVDAELYTFTITPDVTMRMLPAVIEPGRIGNSSLGFQCSIYF